MTDESLAAYFRWFRAQTEAAWRNIDLDFIQPAETWVTSSAWLANTVWQDGLDEHEIAAIEATFGIEFPADYRLFLAILNAPDRGKYGTRWSESGRPERKQDQPSFYDWRKQPQLLASVLRVPLDGLLFDVETNGLWHDSWGKRPIAAVEREQRLAQLYESAPRLIPIIGHRYLVTVPGKKRNPVLSVVQSDIIVYGSDLRKYLESDFKELIDPLLGPPPPDDDYESDIDARDIPFWGELMG